MENQNKTIVILGASNKPERYSCRALHMLCSHGYRVIPIHPTLEEIEGIPVFKGLELVREKVHTLTVYVGPERIQPVIDTIVALKPGRVILNPGTESEELEEKLSENKIPFLHACTLVMLQTGRF